MPTLVLEDVPAEVYERLQKRAAAEKRSLPQETLHLLEQSLRQERVPAARLPEFVPGEEVLPPCDLPRSSRPVRMAAYAGLVRPPEPLPGDVAE